MGEIEKESKETSKSWFAVFNNPEEHGYGSREPDLKGRAREICERLKLEWCVTESRTGAWAYCIKHYTGHYPHYDETGRFVCYRLATTEEEKARVPPDLHHVHMVLEDSKTMRFSIVKSTYAQGMHFEGTKGNKQEAEYYIAKTGAYSEKDKREAGLPWEEIIYVARHGEIRGRQGQRSDMDSISHMLTEGKSPKEITATDFKYYRYENMIRRAYFDKRDRETPEIRELRVIWHVGESGMGKSYGRIRLIEEKGSENVFYLTDYNPSSMWDGYNGQPYLWIEDFKGEIRFGDLLRYLDVYKTELHCRYSNAKALWNEVHITSVLHPLGAYRRMLAEKDRTQDKADQLLRRISCIRYHWRVGERFYAHDFPVGLTLEAMRAATVRLYDSGELRELGEDETIEKKE